MLSILVKGRNRVAHQEPNLRDSALRNAKIGSGFARGRPRCEVDDNAPHGALVLTQDRFDCFADYQSLEGLTGSAVFAGVGPQRVKPVSRDGPTSGALGKPRALVQGMTLRSSLQRSPVGKRVSSWPIAARGTSR